MRRTVGKHNACQAKLFRLISQTFLPVHHPAELLPEIPEAVRTDPADPRPVGRGGAVALMEAFRMIGVQEELLKAEFAMPVVPLSGQWGERHMVQPDARQVVLLPPAPPVVLWHHRECPLSRFHLITGLYPSQFGGISFEPNHTRHPR